MFRGSVPADLRSIILEHVRDWPDGDVYVGCSGNFTIERTLEPLGRRLHGNDVQLYSSALGWWLAGMPVPLTLNPQHADTLNWLVPHLDGGIGTTACVLLASRFAPMLQRRNAYYDRMVAAYRDSFESLHEKTVRRLSAVSLKLGSFTCGDVRAWIADDVPPDAPICCFPPFFAGDYESQFSALGDIFDWPAPCYPELDEHGLQALIDAVADRPRWILGNNQRRPALEPFLRGIVRTTNRGVPIYVYASGTPRRIVQPRQQTEPILAPRLGPAQVIGDHIALAPLTGGQFATIRSQYMNRNIRPGTPLEAYAVTVDGVICGTFAFSSSKFLPDEAYLLSDFPVEPTAYPRLAKLVLYAALSTEARSLLERLLSRRLRTLLTTAYSDRPVSMKYRGLFRLASRAPSSDPLYRYMLNYRSPLGRWSLADGLAEWKKRHGKRDSGDAAN